MVISNMEVDGDGVKSLIQFRSPRDLKGTALLVYGHKAKNDDQWIYMPSLKRVKKIASTNKAGSFVGSEFSFEDLAPPELEKYTYHYMGEESVVLLGAGSVNCFKMERFPVDQDSGYSKQVVWIDQAHYRSGAL